MSNVISGVASGQPTYQPPQVASPQPKAAEASTQPKGDVVTISAKGKQSVQLRTGDYTPAEEAKESPIEKATEAQAGKK